MNAAISKAKQTLDEFDRAPESKNPSYSGFSLKKRYKTNDGGGEHMWITDIQLINRYYKGIVNNDAEKTTEVKYGDTVSVQKNDITDWMYLDKNILKGGYTIREIRKHMSKEEQDQMTKESGFVIKD